MKLSIVLATLMASTVLSLEVAQAQGTQVFIPEGSADQVRVIDAKSRQQVALIEGIDAVHGLAGSPNSPYIVAGSFMEVERAQMAPISKPSSVSEDEHAVHHAPQKQALGPSDAGVSLLSVIDTATGEVVRKIEVPGAVHHVALSPDGQFAVSTHPNGGGISVVDLDIFELVAWIPTGPMPNYAVFGDDPSTVYVSNAGNGTISEVDLQRGIVLRNILAGTSPEHIAIDAKTSRIYAADADAGLILEVDLSTGDETRQIEIGGELHGLDLSDDRSTLFVAAKATDRLVAIDVASGSVTAKQLSPAPYHLTTVTGTGSIFVSSRDEPMVWVVDADTLTAVEEIQIQGEGHQMVVSY